MSGRYCGVCGEMDYSEWGDMPCRCGMPEPEPTWPLRTECAYHGHAYHGDEHGLGRCYCGAKQYPAGGPEDGAS